MAETDDSLNAYLQRLRREAGLSIEQLCERTKIQGRYVRALEEGRFGELPSNTHLRAFSLALAQACGGDPELAALWVRRTLSAVAAPPLAGPTAMAPTQASAARAEEVRAPRPRPVAAPMAAAVAPSGASGLALPRPETAQEVVHEAAEAAEGLLQGASQRLKALPWQALLVLAGGASLLSVGLLWGVHRWQDRLAVAPGEPSAEVEAPAKSALAPVKEAAQSSAGPAVAAVAPVAPAASTELVLRARRPCWLVLQVDGQRLPTVTLQDGDKRSWPVAQRAVLLAGNIGALRVWWRGDNLGYLGELGSRANGLVFEPGKSVRTDKGVHLALPAGVPE